MKENDDKIKIEIGKQWKKRELKDFKTQNWKYLNKIGYKKRELRNKLN